MVFIAREKWEIEEDIRRLQKSILNLARLQADYEAYANHENDEKIAEAHKVIKIYEAELQDLK